MLLVEYIVVPFKLKAGHKVLVSMFCQDVLSQLFTHVFINYSMLDVQFYQQNMITLDVKHAAVAITDTVIFFGTNIDKRAAMHVCTTYLYDQLTS